MDVDYDDIYDTPPPRTGVKRRFTAQIHDRTSKTKLAKRRKTDGLLGPDILTVEDMGGEYPPYNDFASWVLDPQNEKVYMIGGTRPGDKSDTPTSDFYCYNTTNMKWENLTNSFTFREPYTPYSKIDLKREKRPLPPLCQPGCTLWCRGSQSFIFMFGGYDYESGEATSKVIIINLKYREWYEERMPPDANTRIAPAIVAIENKVYIFGGYKKYTGDPQACYSYSIAEHTLGDPKSGRPSTWTWEVLDSPYSGEMPGDSVIGQAIAVDGGSKILLTPGRLNRADKRRLHFSKENLFYFHIKEEAFQQILGPVGDPLPQNIGWYSILKQPLLPTATPLPPQTSITKKRSRPRKNPNPPQVPPPRSLTSSSSSSMDSVLLCAWIPRPGTSIEDSEFAPELYHFSLTPKRVNCLNVIQKVCDLGHDFKRSMLVEGKIHHLGSSSVPNNAPGATWNKHLDIPIHPSS